MSNLEDYQYFLKCQACFKYLCKQSYRTYICKVELSLFRNSKDFWKFVRKNKSSPSIPSPVTLNDIANIDELDSANLFCKHFESVYSLPSPPYLLSFSISTFINPSNIYFSVDDVFHHLLSLRCNYSPGSDGIPGDFFFNLCDIISWSLWSVFRKSLDRGIFPSILKIISLLLFLIAGDPSKVENYRPFANIYHVSNL